MATLIPLAQVEPDLIEQVLDRAFGPDRHARTAYRIRTGMDWLPALSFAALDDDDMLVGTIQIWPVALTDTDGRAHPLLMVGPVAVLPEHQSEGYGKALMLASLQAITDTSGGALALPQVLIGDVEYYGMWGFTAKHTAGWHCPGPNDPARLLVRCDNPAVLPADGMLGPWEGMG
ncbi:GNAT family N-acetyltransferase [Altererythrobacter lutimaris]|uniref:N-acetyltransferase n=1 Tax=Altererythrobacter lutimaris TaxID=2743979 RepID=A0A850HCG1_9SPHN|nr:N-acetyltransferase [Altererythrobacter lutimaris]NVE94616.1 N-acetyltransferase [Altererythrobacter lutimaris]